MKTRTLTLAAALSALAVATPAQAELAKGTKAPTFATQGAEDGKPFAFNLSAALAKGPVVVYFFPKAETPGCNAEAKAFADAMGDFQKAGAQVIGLSTDNLEDLKAFSVKHCSGKFPVATATPAIVKAYDVALGQVANRTTYVIDTDGRIAMAYTDVMKPLEHIAHSLAAVRALKN